MSIIAIANHKGGVGKTTTTCNLAACLARMGRKVLAIDFDSQSHLTMHFKLVPLEIDRTIYNVLTSPGLPVEDVILNVRPKLDLVPSNLDLAGLDLELVAAVNRDQRLRRGLKEIRDRYDYILIDCPPALSFTTLNAFAACDVLLACIQTQMFSFQAVEKLLGTVNNVATEYDFQISAYALPTMFERNSNAHKLILAKVQEYFGPQCFSPIHKNVRCQDAQIAGVPVIEFDQSCSAATDYTRLAKEVTDALEPQKARRPVQRENV